MTGEACLFTFGVPNMRCLVRSFFISAWKKEEKCYKIIVLRAAQEIFQNISKNNSHQIQIRCFKLFHNHFKFYDNYIKLYVKKKPRHSTRK